MSKENSMESPSSSQSTYLTHVDLRQVEAAMRSNDDVGIVLRAQLVVEQALYRVLIAKYPNYNALGHTFGAQHIKALKALLQEPDKSFPLLQVAEAINKLRNKLAHGEIDVTNPIGDEHLKKLHSQAAGAFPMHDLRDFKIQLADTSPKRMDEFGAAHQIFLLCLMTASAIDTIPQREAEAQKVG
jgi:hypothetical protein